jgi:hypothetical protein
MIFEELRDIWAAAVATPYPFGPFYQIAILTLQRRDEVAGMRWSELSPDGCTWLIPGARMKNGKPHDAISSSDNRRSIVVSLLFMTAYGDALVPYSYQRVQGSSPCAPTIETEIKSIGSRRRPIL